MKSRQELIDYLVMCAGWSIKDDAVSRVDVIKAVHDEMYDEQTDKTGSLRLVMNVIGDMPTIEPVRHGKWIDMDEQSYTWKIRCSCCDHERSMMSTQGIYPNYCENCGAKMDAEREL